MDKTTCPECGGEGETWEDVLVGGEHSTHHRRCEPCDGTGEVLVEADEDEDEDEDDDDGPATAEFTREVVA